MKFVFIFLLCLIFTIGYALALQDDNSAFVRKTSNLIATNLLKTSIDIDSNGVYSSFGTAVILAVLAEASSADTYFEFNKVFGYPNEREELRASFKSILTKYYSSENNTNPSFQTWIYVDAEFHIRQEFQQLVETDYLVKVKHSNQYGSDWNETERESAEKTTNNSKDVVGFETLKRTNFNDDSDGNKYKYKNIKKFKIPFNKLLALDNPPPQVITARSLFDTEDIVSALSATSITCLDPNANTKLLLFNGLYYWGNWKNRFYKVTDGNDNFYITSIDAVAKTMMCGEGMFQSAHLNHLKAQAVKIPYQDNKYSMLIIMPDDIEGLRLLIEDLEPHHLIEIKRHLQYKRMRVSLPEFQIEETSHSELMLKKLGLDRLFSNTKDAFSALSDKKHLGLNEIVQYVNIKVESNPNQREDIFETFPSIESGNFEDFIVNHPFIFFLIDEDEDLVITSGKIFIPETKHDAK